MGLGGAAAGGRRSRCPPNPDAACPLHPDSLLCTLIPCPLHHGALHPDAACPLHHSVPYTMVKPAPPLLPLCPTCNWLEGSLPWCMPRPAALSCATLSGSRPGMAATFR